jgi:outer membrane protein
MLSKISIGLNIILLIAVVNLYVKTCNNDDPKEEPVLVEDTTFEKPMKIAFIDTDSLNAHYEYVQFITEELNKEIEKKQRRLERKTSKLQTEFTQLQRLSSSMTQAQLQAAQQRAVEMDNEIQVMQNDLADEVNEERMAMQKTLLEKIDSFMTKYNEKEQYDYILKKFDGSGIIIANDAYNITDTIINLLNDDYQKSKPVN